jgi:hypothetical protein
MLNVPVELKNILKNDRPPLTASPSHKTLKLYFPSLNYTITNDKIKGETFSLTESICQQDNLAFGSCESSQLKVTVANIDFDLSGQVMIASQIINGIYTIPIGTFTVKSCERQNNRWFRDIVAYDNMKKFDVDVSDWYNGLFPTGNETYTLAQFRALLLAYFNIEEDTSNLPLPNDNMVVEKTIEPTQISGRDVLQACEEINGNFGHMGRDGKFKHIVLQPGYGLYPSETLYPSDDLFPVDENDTSYVHESIIDETIGRPMYKEVKFEEYTVKEIDKLIVRSEEDDIGAIAGTGSNTYIIQGNFLVFGKTADELKGIAASALGNMAKRPYRPFKSEGIGLPYVEVGDVLKFDLDNPVTGYVFQRTLTGIQALQDEYTASGNEEREQNFGVNTEIINIKGRTAILKKNVDEVSVNLTDLAQNVDTSFEITHGEINLKVDKAGVIGAINLSHEEAKISASKINLYGYVTVNDLAGEGSTAINGSNITTGTIDASVVNVINLNADNITSGTIVADSVKSNWVYAGSINANQITAGSISGDRINGGTITGVTIVSSGSNGSLEIDGAYIQGRNSSGSLTLNIGPNYMQVSGGIDCSTLNGYTPITIGNISDQSVKYASNAGYASMASSADYLTSGTRMAYISVNDNFIPTSPAMYIGSSDNPWAGGYGISGWQTTSDERLKDEIQDVDNRYLELIKKLSPKRYKMKQGTSGRYHTGFIAQEVERARNECGIDSTEFAGLVKAPVYAEVIKNDKGDIIGYDTTSEIIDYTYHLRYEEIISLLLMYLKDMDARLSVLE